MAEEKEKEKEKDTRHPSIVAFEDAISSFDFSLFSIRDSKIKEKTRKQFTSTVTPLYIQAKRHDIINAKRIWNNYIRPPFEQAL